jgi:hypothetical protein
MAITTLRVKDKNCGTCQWWTGKRQVKFQDNEPYYIYADSSVADCTTQTRSPRPGQSCQQWAQMYLEK